MGVRPPTEEYVVAPGEETVVDIEWSTRSFHPGDAFRGFAEFYTNDPTHPVIEVRLHGEVVNHEGRRTAT